VRAPGRRSLPLVAAIGLVLACAPSAAAEELIALTTGNQLVRFDSATPGNVSSPMAITGLQAGEQIVGIDFRPANATLYGVGSSNRLYTIDPGTGAATPVGPPGFTLDGGSFGVDFNPVPDRLRVVSDADQNLLIDPTTGALAGSGPNLAYAPGDPNFGQNPNVVGSAFENRGGILYGIDYAVNPPALVRQNEATGQLTTVGPLGVIPQALIGFDIAPSDTAYFVAGFPFGSFFHTINLTTGAATSLGQIPVPNINGLTAVRQPIYVIPPGPGGQGQAFTFPGCPPGRVPVVLTGGNDVLRATSSGDLIFGLEGNDLISGLGGDDCIDLGPGADLGHGGPDNDRLLGGFGPDLLTGNDGNDRLFGRLPPTAPLRTGAVGGRASQTGGDRISGGRGRDLLVGGPLADRLFGRRGPDRIRGGRGRDRIAGGLGRDRITGGPGNDRIFARGGGRDRIFCGPGRDRVVAGAGDRLAASCE
jgi:Domain of unknown function (DUF4394)/RTX calcium-binding nonapeptide repeat (4 copies)